MFLTTVISAFRLPKIAFGVVLAGVFLNGGAGAAASGSESSARWPLPVVLVPEPPMPVSIAGYSQLVYELHVTNTAREPLLLQRVEVLDAEKQTPLARIDGDLLARRLHADKLSGDSGNKNSLALVPGGRGVIYLEVAVNGAVPSQLEHRLTFHFQGQAPQQSTDARIPVREESPVVLSAPLRGGPWVAIHSPLWERGHRRVIYTVDGRERIPGRYAIDWMKVDAGGRFAPEDRNKVADWLGYGAEVLAVADGTVVAVRDDFPESSTMSDHRNPPPEDATGNYLALDLGHGRYAFYEHLKPASIRVAPGDRVRRGQVIASLGFTGQTTGPHLHFHLADANSPLGAEGIPFVFEEFTLLGSYGDIGKLGNAPWTSLTHGDMGERRGEMPASNVVLVFAQNK
jgi:hypothetical protein